VSDLLEAGTRKLVLNFAEVPYIDSTGLGFLAGSQKLAQAAAATIVLASVNPHVRKVLDSVQLAQFFQMADSEAAALEKLKASGPAPEGPTPAPAKPTRGRKRPASSPGEQSS